MIYSICFKAVGNNFDAEDITQEVFLSAYKKLGEFDRKYEKAWLSKITANKCLDFLKQAGRRSVPTENEYFLEIKGREASPEEKYLVSESKNDVYMLCSGLKMPYKEVAILHYYDELSVQEISSKTGKNIKTIQTQIYRAKAILKKLMERSG